MTNPNVEATPIILDSLIINATTINLVDSFGVDSKSEEIVTDVVDVELLDIPADATFDMIP